MSDDTSLLPSGETVLAGLGFGDRLSVLGRVRPYRFDGYSLVDEEGGPPLRVYTEVYGTRTFDPELAAVDLAAVASVERAVTRESEIRGDVELGHPRTVEERVAKARERAAALEAAHDEIRDEQSRLVGTSREGLDFAAQRALETRFVELDERRRVTEGRIESLRVEIATLSGDKVTIGETTVYLAAPASSVGAPLPEWRWTTTSGHVQRTLASIANKLDASFHAFSFDPTEIVRALTPVRQGGSGRSLDDVLRSDAILSRVVEGIALRDEPDARLTTSYSILSRDLARGRDAGGGKLEGLARTLAEVRVAALGRVLDARGIDPETGEIARRLPDGLSLLRRRVYAAAGDVEERATWLARVPAGAVLGGWRKVEETTPERTGTWQYSGRSYSDEAAARELTPHAFASGWLERIWRTHHPELDALPTSTERDSSEARAGLPSWMGVNPFLRPDGSFGRYVGEFAGAEYYTRKPFRSRADVEAAIAPYAHLASERTPWTTGSRRVRRGPGAYVTEWFAIVPGISEASTQRVARKAAAERENAIPRESLKKGDRLWSERRKEYVTVVKQLRDNGSKRNFDRVIVADGGRQTREQRARLAWLSEPDLERAVRLYQPVRPRRFELARERDERREIEGARPTPGKVTAPAGPAVAIAAKTPTVVTVRLPVASNAAALLRVARSGIAAGDLAPADAELSFDVPLLPTTGEATPDAVRAAVERLRLRPVVLELGATLSAGLGRGPDGSDALVLDVDGQIPRVAERLRQELGVERSRFEHRLELPVAYVRAGTGLRWAREVSNLAAHYKVVVDALYVSRDGREPERVALLGPKEIERRLEAAPVGAVVDGASKIERGGKRVWVRDGEAKSVEQFARSVSDAGLSDLVRVGRGTAAELPAEVASAAAPVETLDAPAPRPRVTVFRSGVSRVRDFEAFARAGVPVGVEIHEITDQTVERIVAANRARVRLFVDNGAFGAFRRGERIDAADVFARYRALGSRLPNPSAVSWVVPDVVGDQAATLSLVLEHRQEIRELIASGADVLVPLQKSGYSLAEAHARVVRVLGTRDFRAALPSNEAAVTADEVVAFVGEARPERIHLLGIARQARLRTLVEALYEVAPELDVSTDANALRALVGRDRPLTRAVEARLEEASRDAVRNGHAGAGVVDETEATPLVYGEPRYLDEEQAGRLARLLTANQGEQAAIVHAARSREPGREHGSRLGDLLDERYPGQIAEYALWTLFVDDARGALRPLVRSEEITRIEMDAGAPGAEIDPPQRRPEGGTDGDGTERGRGTSAADLGAAPDGTDGGGNGVRVAVGGAAESDGPASVRAVDAGGAAGGEGERSRPEGGRGLFDVARASEGGGRGPDDGAGDRGGGGRAVDGDVRGGAMTDWTAEVEARAREDGGGAENRKLEAIARWRERQAAGVGPRELGLDEWCEFEISSPNYRIVRVLYQPGWGAGNTHIEFRGAKDAGFSPTGYTSHFVREERRQGTNPVEVATAALREIVGERTKGRRRKSPEREAARAAVATTPPGPGREEVVRDVVYAAIAAEPAIEPGWVKPGAYVVREHGGADALMRREGLELAIVPADAGRIARVKGLVALRDVTREILRADAAGDGEAGATARRRLGRYHDVFVSRYGPVSSKTNALAYREDPDATLVLSLETYDARLRTFVRGPIFDGPVVKAAAREPEPGVAPTPAAESRAASAEPETRPFWQLARDEFREAALGGRLDFDVTGGFGSVSELVAAREREQAAGPEHERFLSESFELAVDVEHTGAVFDARAAGETVPARVLASVPALSGSWDSGPLRDLADLRLKVAAARELGRRVVVPTTSGSCELDNRSLRVRHDEVEYLDGANWRRLDERRLVYLRGAFSGVLAELAKRDAQAAEEVTVSTAPDAVPPAVSSATEPVASAVASTMPRTEAEVEGTAAAATASTEPSGSRRLTDAIRALLEDKNVAIDNRLLTAMADDAFGGSRASGAYTVKDAYDAVEVAANEFLAYRAARFLRTDPREGLAEIRETLLARLPRQTDGDRTSEMEQYQQFSSPPTLGFLGARALRLSEGDVFVEPSAGTGSLAIWGRAAGAIVHTNELSGRRRELLADMGFRVTGVDAEHLDDLLPDDVRPTVVLMNPPFSATAGRVERNNTRFGFNHLRSALDRLEPNGRLVAILPEGARFENPRAPGYWSDILGTFTVRANIGLPGGEYSRYGTRYPNQLVVVDKVGPTPGATYSDRVGNVLTPVVSSYEEALDVIERIPERAAVRVAHVGNTLGGAGGGDRGRGPGGALDDRAPDAGLDAGSGGGDAAPDRRVGDGDGGRTSESVAGPGDARPGDAAGARDGGSLDTRPDGDVAVVGDAGPAVEPDVFVPDRIGGLEAAGVVYSSNARAVRVTEEGGTFVSYVPAKLQGARPHPADLVESASMAAVEPPDPTYVPALDASIVRDGVLSEVQLERVVYAGQRHEQLLPDGTRGGYYVGDGTGVGKGRILAGIILDNWNQGRRRALWLSVNYDLVSSTERDLTALGGDVPLNAMNEQSYEPLEIGDGVLFSSYSSLIAKNKDGRTRLEQLMEWLGPEGVIVFDEGHKAKNALGTEMGEPTQTGQAVIDIQAKLPLARVVYASATGATEVRNMAYLTRLGVWGPGTAFPGGFASFLAEIESGGVGSMEMVARDLKALGLYGSASISYQGVDYRESVHELTPEQREIYDAAAKAWQMVFEHFNAAIEVTNGGRRERSRAQIAFWGDHQRFFRQLTTALKVPTAIVEIDRALAEDKSVVVTLIGTGEARTKELVARATAAGESLDDLNFAPVDVIKNLVRRAFPVTKYEEYTEPGSNVIRRRPVKDEEGKVVQSKSAIRMREEVLAKLDGMILPEGPLDQLVNHYGPEKVAELTGRKKRLVYNAKEKRREYVPRLAGIPAAMMNEHEMRAFQSGTKRIAIISDAASTGISLHASNREANTRRRVHVTLELGWSADKQMQTFGRTHRSDQAIPPEYVLLATELGGEKRFCSTIARRLASLGALTKGQRDASGAGDLARYDFESKYGQSATHTVYRALERNDVPTELRAAVGDARETLVAMGVVGARPGVGPEQVSQEDLYNVGRFLNRVLALEVDRQNAVFEMFSRAFEQSVTFAKQQGLFDVGVTDIKGISVARKEEPTLVHRDETTGARTSHFVLNVREATHPVSWNEAERFRGQERGAAYYVQKRSGNVILTEETGMRTDAATGKPIKRFRAHRPTGFERSNIVDELELAAKYQLVGPATAEPRWKEGYAKDPGFRDREVHLIGGALLPIWDRMKAGGGAALKIVRVETDDGERIVGVEIPNDRVAHVLRAIGVSRGARSPEELFEAVRGGEVVELVGGLRLQAVPFKGDEALQIKNIPRDQTREATRLGALFERRGWEDFVYIPSDPTRGPEILGRFLERYPTLDAAREEEVARTRAEAARVTAFGPESVRPAQAPRREFEVPIPEPGEVVEMEAEETERVRKTLVQMRGLRESVERAATRMLGGEARALERRDERAEERRTERDAEGRAPSVGPEIGR